ncbi:MAG: hypothetical protein KAG66_22155 [Methylococcales bacterium]|nr:hypothetical protein [Methylococcales bacterium]
MADGQPAVRILRAIKRVASFLLAASNGDLMSAKRLSDNSTKFYQGIIDQLTENVTANKTTPEDSYTGDDRAALEKFVYAHLLGEEIVGVYFRGGWYQEKKQNWVASNASFEEVNRSSLEGMVLTKIDNEWALERWIRLIKDHMNGDKLILQRDRQPNPNPRPSEKIHLSKV